MEGHAQPIRSKTAVINKLSPRTLNSKDKCGYKFEGGGIKSMSSVPLLESGTCIRSSVSHCLSPMPTNVNYKLPPLSMSPQYFAAPAEKDVVTLRQEEKPLEKGDAAMSESDYFRRRGELNRLLRNDDPEITEIIQERDQARKDKKNVESAYADVQEKFERVLKTLISLKGKEDLLVDRDNENMGKLTQMDKDLEKYKETARKEVESEYQNWLSKLAEAEATNLRLKAMIRKADMKVDKLEHELSQKNKENDQLHDLCDELINSSSRKNSVQS